MDKGNLEIDPRGLIFESYRISGIEMKECRSIFLDWAMGLPLGTDMQAALGALAAEYVTSHPDHPMSKVISEGLARRPAMQPRRRGRKSRKF